VAGIVSNIGTLSLVQTGTLLDSVDLKLVYSRLSGCGLFGLRIIHAWFFLEFTEYLIHKIKHYKYIHTR
jgi:hypothetical protein